MNTRKLSLTVPNYAAESAQLLAEARLNAGMITSVDSVDIPNGALTLALNARVRLDKTSRRYGKINESPAKPNSNKVLGIYVLKENNGTVTFLRFTKSSIHKRSGAWTALTAGTGGTLTGGDNDYFSTCVVQNKFFYANGVDKIQRLDTTAVTYKEAGANAPKVKFITGFFNRVVGAYRVEGSEPDGPVTVVWCADADTTKWPNDVTPDPSSGQSPIIESPSDYADFATGIFGGPSYLILAREKSLWVATKQPSGSAPFNFSNTQVGIGSDSPNSIQRTPGGLTFLDYRTGQVYAWQVGSYPEEIGASVFTDIIAAIDDPLKIFSGYDTQQQEYSIGIPIAGTTVIRVWTFSRRTKSWVYDEIDLLSCLGDIDSPFSNTTSFDELVGTFDQLTGTFDQLGVTTVGKPARYFGYTNGEIYAEDKSSDTDVGVNYSTDIQSKDFHQPGIDTYFSRIKLKYQSKKAGSLILSYSKDRGKSWIVSKTVTYGAADIKSIEHVRSVKAERLRWRITASSGLLDLIEYSVHVSPSGETQENK